MWSKKIIFRMWPGSCSFIGFQVNAALLKSRPTRNASAGCKIQWENLFGTYCMNYEMNTVESSDYCEINSGENSFSHTGIWQVAKSVKFFCIFHIHKGTFHNPPRLLTVLNF